MIRLKKTHEGETFEDYIARNLSRLFPGLKLVSRHKRISNGGIIDIYAKGLRGEEYYIEVKATDCNRLNIGQAVEYKARLTKVNPEAKMILVCRDAEVPIKEILSGMGIQVRTFAELKIPEKEEISEYEPNKLLSLRLSPTEQKAYFALLRKGITIAKAEDLASVINVSETWAKNILPKLAKRGAAYRVGKGKYAIIPADVIYARKSYVADSLVLVSELMKGKEHYIAYQSAANLHGIAEQLPFAVRVALLKQRKSFSVGKTRIEFVTLNRKKFFGVMQIKYEEHFLNVSDLEKTVLDCLDRSELCGGIGEATRTVSNAIERVDKKRLVEYLEKMGSYSLAQRLGFILEKLKSKLKAGHSVEEALLKKIERLKSSYVYPLDPFSEKKGKKSKRWNIIENANCLRW